MFAALPWADPMLHDCSQVAKITPDTGNTHCYSRNLNTYNVGQSDDLTYTCEHRYTRCNRRIAVPAWPQLSSIPKLAEP